MNHIHDHSSSYEIVMMVLEEINESIKNEENLTQSDFAKEVKLSRSYFNRILKYNVKYLRGDVIIYLMYRLGMIKGVR